MWGTIYGVASGILHGRADPAEAARLYAGVLGAARGLLLPPPDRAARVLELAAQEHPGPQGKRSRPTGRTRAARAYVPPPSARGRLPRPSSTSPPRLRRPPGRGWPATPPRPPPARAASLRLLLPYITAAPADGPLGVHPPGGGAGRGLAARR